MYVYGLSLYRHCNGQNSMDSLGFHRKIDRQSNERKIRRGNGRLLHQYASQRHTKAIKYRSSAIDTVLAKCTVCVLLSQKMSALNQLGCLVTVIRSFSRVCSDKNGRAEQKISR